MLGTWGTPNILKAGSEKGNERITESTKCTLGWSKDSFYACELDLLPWFLSLSSTAGKFGQVTSSVHGSVLHRYGGMTAPPALAWGSRHAGCCQVLQSQHLQRLEEGEGRRWDAGALQWSQLLSHSCRDWRKTASQSHTSKDLEHWPEAPRRSLAQPSPLE